MTLFLEGLWKVTQRAPLTACCYMDIRHAYFKPWATPPCSGARLPSTRNSLPAFLSSKDLAFARASVCARARFVVGFASRILSQPSLERLADHLFRRKFHEIVMHRPKSAQLIRG
jgi:hypothetical protein